MAATNGKDDCSLAVTQGGAVALIAAHANPASLPLVFRKDVN